MKAILFVTLALLIARGHAETASSDSAEFPVELGSARSVAAVTSIEFPVDLRMKGGVGSTGSAEFGLNTMTYAPGTLEVTAPQTVVAGSASPYLVLWHAGATQLNVTNKVGCRFLSPPPDGTGCGPGTFYAGDVAAPTTVQVVFWYYFDANGHSQESTPFSITILPRLQGSLTAARQGTTGGVVVYTATVNRPATVRWDTDHDGQFDDGMASSITVDYGTATGPVNATAKITDGAGGEIIRTGTIALNKPLVVNQPQVTIPQVDPAGFELFNGDSANSTFAFDPARKNNGLVVIAHGLFSDAKQPWLREMTDAIEDRCVSEGKGLPNIALMDWSRDAADPAPMSAASKWIIRGLKGGLSLTGNKSAATSAGAGAIAIEYSMKLWGVRDLGIKNGQLLANWTYANSRLVSSHPINADAPIHFIGHSAGGFVCGEAARLLKHPGVQQGTALRTPIYVDLVTLLDTPFPPANHLSSDNKGFPSPGITQRLISSNFGVLDTWPALKATEGFYYSRQNIFKSNSLVDLWSPLDNGHGYAYGWYIGETDLGHGGFTSSPIINPAARIPKPYMPPQAAPVPKNQPVPAPPLYPNIVPTGWETFGNASENAGTWTLTELDDSGIWKDLALPATAATLAFEFHFLTAGDGDFLAVHFGDNPVLYQGLDLPLSRDAWLPAVIPLDLLPLESLSGKLVFTLVSRGGVNAQVQLRNIRITQSEDADADGLAATAEAAAGSDPRNPDTDGDGISDGDEVNTHGTDPLCADSDGDGQNDAAELAAGTNPLMNGSSLRVMTVAKTAQGFMLQWTGVAGRHYRVVRSQDLGTFNLDFLKTGLEGVNGPMSYTDPNPPPLRAFYWVEVE